MQRCKLGHNQCLRLCLSPARQFYAAAWCLGNILPPLAQLKSAHFGARCLLYLIRPISRISSGSRGSSRQRCGASNLGRLFGKCNYASRYPNQLVYTIWKHWAPSTILEAKSILSVTCDSMTAYGSHIPPSHFAARWAGLGCACPLSSPEHPMFTRIRYQGSQPFVIVHGSQYSQVRFMGSSHSSE